MKFLEKHWWVILAVLALWWLAGISSRTTTISDPTTDPSTSGSVWDWLGLSALF